MRIGQGALQVPQRKRRAIGRCLVVIDGRTKDPASGPSINATNQITRREVFDLHFEGGIFHSQGGVMIRAPEALKLGRCAAGPPLVDRARLPQPATANRRPALSVEAFGIQKLPNPRPVDIERTRANVLAQRNRNSLLWAGVQLSFATGAACVAAARVRYRG